MNIQQSIQLNNDSPTCEFENIESNHKTILIVDDDKTLGFLARQVLEKNGYAVEVACNANEAIQIFTESDISAVLLDLSMPRVNGFELCQLLRLSDKGLDIPVIVISGNFNNSTVDQAFAYGATDFVRKPVNWKILQKRLDNTLQHMLAKQKLFESEKSLSMLMNCIDD